MCALHMCVCIVTVCVYVCVCVCACARVRVYKGVYTNVKNMVLLKDNVVFAGIQLEYVIHYVNLSTSMLYAWTFQSLQAHETLEFTYRN